MTRPEPITAEAFAPYGTLLPGPGAGARINFAAEITNHRANTRMNLATLRAPMLQEPAMFDVLERHPHSAQAFIPLDVARYLVLVLDGDGEPDTTTARAFVVPGTWGIVYRANVWHAPMKTLDRPGVFTMLIHEDGTAADTEFRSVAGVRVKA